MNSSGNEIILSLNSEHGAPQSQTINPHNANTSTTTPRAPKPNNKAHNEMLPRCRQPHLTCSLLTAWPAPLGPHLCFPVPSSLHPPVSGPQAHHHAGHTSSVAATTVVGAGGSVRALAGHLCAPASPLGIACPRAPVHGLPAGAPAWDAFWCCGSLGLQGSRSGQEGASMRISVLCTRARARVPDAYVRVCTWSLPLTHGDGHVPWQVYKSAAAAS